VFENRMLRGTFGPREKEESGEWIKPHKKELNGL
jgi:hypothetical protein